MNLTISPTFYARILCTKVLRAAFLRLHFGFVIFWRKNIDTRGGHKIWMNLTSAGIHSWQNIHPRTTATIISLDTKWYAQQMVI